MTNYDSLEWDRKEESRQGHLVDHICLILMGALHDVIEVDLNDP